MNALISFALFHCAGNGVEKATVFFSIFQEGGLAKQDAISANDKDFPDGMDKHLNLTTLDLVKLMADIEGILSKEEMEEIGLEPDQVKVLKGCFDGFADEDGAIPADNVGGILSMMGMKFKPTALREIIEEIDEDGNIF